MSYPSGDQPQYPGGPQGYSQGRYPPAGTPPQGYYQPRKKPKWPWLVGGIVVIFLLFVAGCIAVFAGVVNKVDDEVNSEVTVTYQVMGTSNDASITYLGRDLGMAQETAVGLPWDRDVAIEGWGKIVSLTANNGADGGDITCRILVGGKVMSEQTSSGPYASATCSGDAGEQ